ncbi:trimeric intracellular cation channel family protein [Carnobacterium funditum]|uniref:trimeric intracellular cation channel family protein n=1 Tax=Carnobacterium funditum TaxID=2752 RepID=UPI000AD5477F|nr:trimeric intracellular cation channel family protein [Carnobacterium funditum]
MSKMESENVGTWEVFLIVGTISFSLQGSLIAMEKKYDLFGVYLFGILTAFGGGAVRNTLIDAPDYELWQQGSLFYSAMIAITLILLFPKPFLASRKLWENFLDSLGLIAFSIHGATVAVKLGLPVSAVVVSALLTATGGGIIRDLLSQRQPIVLGEVVYRLWVCLIGLIIGMGWTTETWHLYLLFIVFTLLRVLSFLYDWKVPVRRYSE